MPQRLQVCLRTPFLRTRGGFSKEGCAAARDAARLIGAYAVAFVEAKQLPARLVRETERLSNGACNLTRLRIIRMLRDVGAIAPTRTGNIVRYRLTDAPSARILEAFARAFDVLRDR